MSSARSATVTYGSVCSNRRHFCQNATSYIKCNNAHAHTDTINLATYDGVIECAAGSVCNLQYTSRKPCLQVHRDFVHRFSRRLHLIKKIKKKRQQQQQDPEDEMLDEQVSGGGASHYPNLQNFASLLTRPQPPQPSINRPPPESLASIQDEIAFLSELPSFPIQRPNDTSDPTASPHNIDDNELGMWADEMAVDEQKPVETAAEPFRCRFYGRYAHPTDCRRYYQCHGSGPNFTERTCDDGLAFNPRWLRCENDWSNCKDIPWCKANNQLLPDFHDKQRYFICVRRSYIFFVEDYSVYRRSCMPDQVFDLQKQRCH